MSGAVPVVRADGEGERLRFAGGGIITVKAAGAETDGALLVFEDVMERGKSTPLHVHAGEDEALYVVEGEILVHIDGRDHVVGARGLAVAPRGVAHAFLVTSATARVLTVQTPAGAEAFYREASDPAGPADGPEPPPDVDRVMAAAQRTGGMRVVGPPPFGALPAP